MNGTDVLTDEMVRFLLDRLTEDELKVEHMQAAARRAEDINPGAVLDKLFGVDIFVLPDRWAAECRVKRDVIKLYRQYVAAIQQESMAAKPSTPLPKGLYAARGALAEVVRLMLRPYKSHLDYRKEWEL